MKKNTKLKAKKLPSQTRSKAGSEILFISLVAVGLVYLLALFTYSTNENPWSGDVLLSTPVANAAGVFGAYLSDISLSIFGLSAYIIPASLILLGWRTHQNINQDKTPKSVVVVRLTALINLIAYSAAN